MAQCCVCMSVVCNARTVAKRCVLPKNCPKKQIVDLVEIGIRRDFKFIGVIMQDTSRPNWDSHGFQLGSELFGQNLL